MAHNLIVSFDVRDPYRENPPVLSALEELGETTRLFTSTWYVRSNLTASEAAKRVWDVMDDADALLVIDASGNEAAMFNLDEQCVQFMSHCWHLAVAEVQPPDAAASEVAPFVRQAQSAAG